MEEKLQRKQAVDGRGGGRFCWFPITAGKPRFGRAPGRRRVQGVPHVQSPAPSLLFQGRGDNREVCNSFLFMGCFI